MAGDWIKFELTTPDKPEVVMMAARLRIDQDAVVGKLLRIWAWADANTVAGDAMPITEAFIDRLTSHKRFAAAMREAGWLEGEDMSLRFPHFDRHNGVTAKTRAETNRRVAKFRKGKQKGNAGETESETEDALPDPLQKPLPEKRREDVNTGRERMGARRPTLAQAESYGLQIGITREVASVWWHKREASEWMKGTGGGGTTPVGSNWQADLMASKSWAEEEAAKARRRPAGSHAGTGYNESTHID